MSAYLRFPTVRAGTVVFVHDDDLWSVPLGGGDARRLTTSRAHVSHPRLSPDGQRVAYVAADEGLRDAYLVHLEGGPPTRLTWEGDVASISGWLDDDTVVVASSAGLPFRRPNRLIAVPVDGSPAHTLPVGQAMGWDPGPKGKAVLCRHVDDTARWKRYRGGRAGALWIDRKGKGRFERLIELDGNLANPLWIGRRIWFVSDHAHWGNLYSVRTTGKDLRKHTDHTGLFVRHPTHDGETIVYHRGGELWRLDGPKAEPERIEVALRASADQTRRRFIQAPRFVQGQDLHPSGHAIALEVRGRPFTMPHFEGPVRQIGEADGVRYRLIRWLAGGKKLVATSDAGGTEHLEVLGPRGTAKVVAPDDLGRPVALLPSPVSADRVAVANHRNELALVDLDSGERTAIDRAMGGPIAGIDWSPDGQWLAWGRPEAGGGTRICLWHADHGVVELTDGRHADWGPSFSPDGDLLYFLSRRDYDPVYDTQFFELSFPRGSRPWAVTLQADQPHPFRARPRPIDQKANRKRRTEPPEVKIDLEGLLDRAVPMPIKESIYGRVIAVGGGNVLMTRRGPQGSLGNSWADGGPPKADQILLMWDSFKRELVSVHDKVTDFGVDLARRSAWIRSGWKLRVFPANADKGPREELKKTRGAPPGRRSGWLDLTRVRCSVDPRAEWRQVFDETWRLVRENFWDKDLSGVDWDAAHARYRPLVEDVATREELSDVLWTLIGELGTSHAYEMGGDLRRPPRWPTGRLAADLEWDADADAWTIRHICRGDPGLADRSSPLLEPGIGAREGDQLLAVDSQPLAADFPPARALTHRANQLVRLTLRRGEDTREVVVRARASDRTARYRDWVRHNRERVHEATNGQCGYVHIPNMGPGGYADFHRDYAVESTHPHLLVDVRFNGGGHVSQLLLEKLARRALAWTVPRHSAPQRYPRNTILGSMCCLTNEYAGSDGDIFSHNWKQLGLGPLIGRRTWGGVVGIWPRHRLVDGTITTQPEFAFWFPDVGWGVENRGTDPDIEQDIAPHEEARGEDPQLEAGIAWILEQMAEGPVGEPDFGPSPHRGDPR